MHLHDIFVYGIILNQLYNWQNCLKLKKSQAGHKETFFFTVRTVEHWSRLPREAVQSASSEVFKIQLYKALSSLFWPHH